MADELVTQVSQHDEGRQNVGRGRRNDSKESSCCWRLFCFPFANKSNSSETRIISSGQGGTGDTEQTKQYLLPPLSEKFAGRKTLVLDLDETLVHSSFKPISNADFVISIELEGTIHKVFVRKRPYVDEFLRAVAKKYEIVIFTASLAKYADPLLDILDKEGTCGMRLFREACVQHYGNFVKDLTHLGREMKKTIIIDNSPFSYMFQPENSIPITSWFTDDKDRELLELLPFLDKVAEVDDVVDELHKWQPPDNN